MWTVTPPKVEEMAEARIRVPAKPLPALSSCIGRRQRPPAFREEPFIDPELAWAVTG